jgi:hypothetical protein
MMLRPSEKRIDDLGLEPQQFPIQEFVRGQAPSGIQGAEIGQPGHSPEKKSIANNRK